MNVIKAYLFKKMYVYDHYSSFSRTALQHSGEHKNKRTFAYKSNRKNILP